MLPTYTFRHTEDERLQQALFIELLRLAPEGAELYCTNDSGEELLALLVRRMRVVTENNYDYWVVSLTPESRTFLGQQALQRDIQVTFVHFYIKANQRNLFISYDCILALQLDPDFPEYERLAKNYASILML